MARIDSFLVQLIGLEAEALIIEAGDNLYLVTGQHKRALMQAKPGAIQNAHVVALLCEIAPAQLRETVQRCGPCAWQYSFGTCLFHVEQRLVGDRLVASIREVKERAVDAEVLTDFAPPADGDDLPDARPAVERLFRRMVTMGGSDLHLTAGRVPMVRVDGEMRALPEAEKLDAYTLESMLREILPARNKIELEQVNDTDFAYEIDVARIRCNCFRDRTGIGGVFRKIPTKILSAGELNLPPSVLEMCKLRKGLVVVTGPTGSGKSTTLAAMVDWINDNRSDHIITIEDPIEFVHEPKKCLVNQRQVGEHTGTFSRALRAALREDPDIILVGEMRDLETVAAAIEIAETGHLVFGTLHTTTAASTVDRIVDQFPADRQEQIRQMLSESLKGVVAQTLCKKIGGGRAAALEVLVCNNAVSNLIREKKTFQLPSVMQTSRGIGMRTLNDALFELVQSGAVDKEEAMSRAVDKPGLAAMFKGADQAPHSAVQGTAALTPAAEYAARVADAAAKVRSGTLSVIRGASGAAS